MSGVHAKKFPVELVSTLDSNPPVDGIRPGKEDFLDIVGSALIIRDISLDLSLTLYPKIEVYSAGSLSGVKAQFLGPSSLITHDKWVGSALIGAGNNPQK